MILFMTSILSSSLFAQKADIIADFSFSIDMDRPSQIHFTDLSTGDPTAWEWNFHDFPDGGSFSYGQHPLHSFPKNGEFEVTLTVSNDTSTDQITKTIIIDVPLTINFIFQLDSSNIIPNTFIFDAEVEGYYDDLSWVFENQTMLAKEDTVHSYSQQDKDYQVCLIAQYIFNDTSIMKKTLCKGLTTSEYYDLGGQVYFGDSLMNNPYATGDSAIAYLYRVDGNHMTPVDTNHFHYLGYYWFPQKLKAYYIVKTALTESSNHYAGFAPTYVGNTTDWEEAEIINLAQNKFREDVMLVENANLKNGTSNIEGSIFDILPSNSTENDAVVYLFNIDDRLINYQYTDEDGQYIFYDISEGHYTLRADLTGIHVRPQLIYVDGKSNRDFKSAKVNSKVELFPNPAKEYSILSYSNTGDSREINIQFLSVNGQLIKEQNAIIHHGENYLSLDLNSVSKGLVIVKLMDGQERKYWKLLHN